MKYICLLLLFCSCNNSADFIDTKDVDSPITMNLPKTEPKECNVFIRKGINVDCSFKTEELSPTETLSISVWSEIQNSVFTMEVSDNKTPWMDIVKADMQVFPSATCFKYKVWSSTSASVYFAPLRARN